MRPKALEKAILFKGFSANRTKGQDCAGRDVSVGMAIGATAVGGTEVFVGCIRLATGGADVSVGGGTGVSAGTGVSVGAGTGVSVGMGTSVSVGTGTGVSVGTGIGVSVGASVSVGTGVAVSTGTGVPVGAGSAVPVGTSVPVEKEVADVPGGFLLDLLVG